jgi:hypothetical protein
MQIHCWTAAQACMWHHLWKVRTALTPIACRSLLDISEPESRVESTPEGHVFVAYYFL